MVERSLPTRRSCWSPIARSKIMIIWIASSQSGNTYLRSFIASYYFSKKGKFDFDLLLNILQFPSIKFSKKKLILNSRRVKIGSTPTAIFLRDKFFIKTIIVLINIKEMILQQKIYLLVLYM